MLGGCGGRRATTDHRLLTVPDKNGRESRIRPDPTRRALSRSHASPQNRNAPRQRTRRATPSRAAATGNSELAMLSFLSPFVHRWLYCPGIILTKSFVSLQCSRFGLPLFGVVYHRRSAAGTSGITDCHTGVVDSNPDIDVRLPRCACILNSGAILRIISYSHVWRGAEFGCLRFLHKFSALSATCSPDRASHWKRTSGAIQRFDCLRLNHDTFRYPCTSIELMAYLSSSSPRRVVPNSVRAGMQQIQGSCLDMPMAFPQSHNRTIVHIVTISLACRNPEGHHTFNDHLLAQYSMCCHRPMVM